MVNDEKNIYVKNYLGEGLYNLAEKSIKVEKDLKFYNY